MHDSTPRKFCWIYGVIEGEGETHWYPHAVVDHDLLNHAMSPLWRKALPSPNAEEIARETIVKSSLTKGLGQAIKVLQQEHTICEESIPSCEISNSVCNFLEAVFIHGLKDTFIRRVSAILSGNVDKIPEPNFWPFLLVFSHKDVISQITDLSQITTDIGRCRAWIRIALNDGLLESYLGAMVKDKKSLEYYYSHTAYLRDGEQPDILRKFVEGLAIFNFKLVSNIPSLNYWTATPLMLAGIWAPPLAPEPVFTGLDIASYLAEDGSLSPSRRRRVKPADSALTDSYSPQDGSGEMSFGIPCPPNPRPDTLALRGSLHSMSSSPASCPDPPAPLVNYDNHRNIDNSSEVNDNVVDNVVQSIEETVVRDASEDLNDNDAMTSSDGSNGHKTENHSLFSPGLLLQTPSDIARGIADGVAEAETSEDLENLPHVGNSLSGMPGWSSSFDEGRLDGVDIPLHNTVRESESFNTLLKNYSPVQGSVIRTPNFNDIVDQMVSTEVGSPNERIRPVITPEDTLDDILEFEIIPKSFSITSKHVDALTQSLIELIGKIQNEKGLDAQNFQCNGCARPVGMIYGKARVCGYNGSYYCYECHENDEFVIPARIIHNWDFKKYKVAKYTKLFLEQIEEEPLIDIRKFNPSIYTAIEEMNEVLALRTQLSYLRSYLFTCRESVAEELRKKVWPKEHLYEHIHLYSLSDLLSVPGGSLAQYLHKIISFATKHVTECRLCSQKGFICEVCNSQKVIYPFQVDCTYRCEECLAVFHEKCMSDKKPCPKCTRMKQRIEGEHENIDDNSREDEYSSEFKQH